MFFSDRVGITSKRKLPDGRLVVDARFARAGIYEYAGSEVGRADMATVRVYRPPEEVFDADSMASFAFKAVTDDHPIDMVNATNWRDVAKGFTDGEVKRDGEFVRVPMMLADADLVAKVDSGKAELSAGYDAELTFEVGRTPDGEHYDAVMRSIRGNHIAVVDKGRAGAECRIADKLNEGAETMPETVTPTRMAAFDSIPYVTTDAAEAVVAKLKGMLADAGKTLEDERKAHADAIAAKDKELGTKDAEIADLRAKVLTDEALDAAVAERAALLTDVALVAPKLDTKGKKPADIRRDAVVALLADDAASVAALKDKSDDYVSALFDARVARAKASDDGTGSGRRDPLADALGDTLPGGGTGNGAPRSGSDAYKRMTDDLGKRWENPDKVAA